MVFPSLLRFNWRNNFARAVPNVSTQLSNPPIHVHTHKFSRQHSAVGPTTPPYTYMWTAMDRVRAAGSVILWIGK